MRAPEGRSQMRETRSHGEIVLHAVERISATPAEIQGIVDEISSRVGSRVDLIAEEIIARWSDRAALVGAATALPAFVPGIGTVACLTAGPLADVILLMKLESEMCLALAAAHGHDIRLPRERQLALLLAALTTVKVHGGKCDLGDAAEVVGDSIWNYAPRRMGKFLVTALGAVVAISLSRRLLIAIPLVGIGVGLAMNKLLTRRVGNRAHAELLLRSRIESLPTAQAG
jgi:hypothetical protein